MNDNQIWRRARADEGAGIDQGLRSHMLSVYNYMMMGLGLTGLVTFSLLMTPNILFALMSSPLIYVFIFAPLGVVMYLSMRIEKLSFSQAQMWFWVYAGINGVSIAAITVGYTIPSVFKVFFITSATFGAMSLYGYTTKKDLSSWGSFLFMGVIGLFIASLVNIFTQSSAFSYVISFVAVLVFTGLTAYDTQKIKEMYYEGDSSEISGKKGVLGALTLYIDFIALFVHLLRLLGDRR
jgi:hypothetical protein